MSRAAHSSPTDSFREVGPGHAQHPLMVASNLSSCATIRAAISMHTQQFSSCACRARYHDKSLARQTCPPHHCITMLVSRCFERSFFPATQQPKDLIPACPLCPHILLQAPLDRSIPHQSSITGPLSVFGPDTWTSVSQAQCHTHLYTRQGTHTRTWSEGQPAHAGLTPTHASIAAHITDYAAGKIIATATLQWQWFSQLAKMGGCSLRSWHSTSSKPHGPPPSQYSPHPPSQTKHPSYMPRDGWAGPSSWLLCGA